MEFRLAKKQEFDSVRDLYWMLIDETSHLPSFPHWKKGLHPSDEWLLESLEKSQMFVLEENGEILASVILNSKANEQPIDKPSAGSTFKRGEDFIPAKLIDEAGLKGYTIGGAQVSPKHAGKGLGTKMMQYILDYAKEIKMQAVRLDVISNNSSAEHLYQKMGFRFVQTQRLYYEVTGERDFNLYEYYL